MHAAQPCPVCDTSANVSAPRQLSDHEYGHTVDCPRCGSFSLSEEALEDLPGLTQGEEDRKRCTQQSLMPFSR